MSSYSLSVVTGNFSHSSSSSTWHDNHFSLHLFPFQPKPRIKIAPLRLNHVLNYSPSFSLSKSFIECVSDAAVLDSVELCTEETETETETEIQETENQVDDKENEVVNSVENGRLYVGNFPFSMTSIQLSEIFAEAGRVVSAEIMYDRVTDRSRGFAFVTMGSAEEVKEAIRLFDGAQIGGRSVRVNFPEVPKGGEREVMSPKIRSSYQGFVDSPHKIYAGNLSWSLTSENLREAFAEHPGFLSAKIVYERDSCRSRGFGFITFASAQEVESALNAMNGVELEGRPLRLNLAEQRAHLSPSPVV